MSAEPRAKPHLDASTFEAIHALRVQGFTLAQIADALDLRVTGARVLQLWQARAGLEHQRELREAIAARSRERQAQREERRRAGPPTRDARIAADNAAARKRIIDAIRDWVEIFSEPPAASDWNSVQRAALSGKQARYAATGRPWPSHSAVFRIFGTWNTATPPPASRRGPEAGARAARHSECADYASRLTRYSVRCADHPGRADREASRSRRSVSLRSLVSLNRCAVPWK